MLSITTSFYKIITILMVLLIYSNFNCVWANNFIPRGHYVIDLGQKLEWLTCPVGMVWNNKTCVGKPLKLKYDKMDTVISQANSQLEGDWRLPKREELEKIVLSIPNSLAFAVIKIENSSSVPAIPSASATQASLPDAIIIPLSKFSTETSSPIIINIEEYPDVDNLHALSEIINFSSILKSPDLIKSKAIIEVMIFVIDAG